MVLQFHILMSLCIMGINNLIPRVTPTTSYLERQLFSFETEVFVYLMEFLNPYRVCS